MDAVERLEFEAIRGALLVRSHTPLGEAEVNRLAPFVHRDAALDRIEAIRQTRSLLDIDRAPPVWGAENVEAALELGEKGIMLEGPQLRAIAKTMSTGTGLRRHLIETEEQAPALFGMAASLVDLSRTANRVHGAFDANGLLSDSASPELGPLRQRVRALKETISGKITELLTSTKMQSILQDNFYTIRGDRYVLPIKSSFKNSLKGIVHDTSGSGETVYIEPQILVDLGNRLKIAQSDQKDEENRILSVLTVLVAGEAPAVRVMMQIIGLVDLLSACASLANDLSCVAIKPDVEPGFALIRAKHPLLLLQAIAPMPVLEEGQVAPKKLKLSEVVGNDFGLEPGQSILVLTGPNTGGKTVAMKTIGLLALMARLGLHLPCSEGSRIGWYKHIEVAIGDQQSIASNLSTFAAHMQRLVSILDRAQPGDLVLIDEIAADTDPNQGQALGQAILERLADLKTHTIVTTHFERIKAVPFTDKRFRNAGVGFDSKKLCPTYRVTLDVPQGSSGFDIAHGLGLSAELVQRSRDLTGDGSQELEALIKEIESRSSELEQAKLQVEEARDEAQAAEARAREKERLLGKEIDRVRRKARAELLEEIERSRAEVGKIVGDLQKAAGSDMIKDAMRQANQVADKLGKIRKAEEEKQAKDAEPKPVESKPISGVKVGDWVFVAKVGRDGDVVAIDGKEAQVAVGNIRMRVPLKSLGSAKTRRPKAAKSAQQREAKRAKKKDPAAPKEEEKYVLEEVDVRGTMVDECLDRLDTFLDHHYNMATTHVRVVHGHGTGALRSAVREHLGRSGYVKEVRPGERGEGGDGATVLTLR